MADYRRMEWQYWTNRIAGWLTTLCVLAAAPEIVDTMSRHFPWWEDVLDVVTLVIGAIAKFIHTRTKMYRFDLDDNPTTGEPGPWDGIS